MYPCPIKRKALTFKDFMKKYNLKNDTMNESELQRIYEILIYPRDSKIYSDRGFVRIDSGSPGGTHWTCFIVKDKKLYYFDSFGGANISFNLIRTLGFYLITFTKSSILILIIHFKQSCLNK